MFFTDEVLSKRGGKFAIIWLAAIKRNSVKKREYERVNVHDICNELRKHFKPALSGRMASVKGFSLRLSAQLVYGVSVVYNVQVQNLYKEISIAMQRIHRYQARLQLCPTDLDVTHPTLAAVQDLPPEAMRLEDPMYGLDMEPHCLFGPEFLTQLSSDQSFSNGSRSGASEKGRDLHTVHDMATITLPEDIPMQSIHDELLTGDGGITTAEELLDFYGETMFDNLRVHHPVADQNTTTPSASVQPTAPVPERPSKDSQSTRKRKTKEVRDDESLLAFPIPHQAAPGDQEIAVEAPQEVTLSTQPGMLNLPAEPNLSNIIPTEVGLSSESSELVLDPVVPNIRTRARIAQSLVDETIELSTENMREQMKKPLNNINNYGEKGFLTQPSSLQSSKKLFQTRCWAYRQGNMGRFNPFEQQEMRRGQSEGPISDHFSEMVELLEKDNALPQNQSKPFSAHREFGLRRPEDEYEAMPDGPGDRTRDFANMSGESSVHARNTSELGRGMASLMEGIPEADATFHDLGMSRTLDEPSSELVQTSIIDQARVEDLTFQPDEPPSLNVSRVAWRHHLLDTIEGFLAEIRGPLTFSTLAPPNKKSKREAARTFYNILELAKEEKLHLSQERPYEEINILLF